MPDYPVTKSFPSVQAAPEELEDDLQLSPALRQFLDGLAEMLAHDLYQKGWRVVESESDVPAMVEPSAC